MSGLPPSLKRRAARKLADRERNVLDNLKLMRDLESGAFAGPGVEPDAGHYYAAAEGLGLRLDDWGDYAVFMDGDRPRVVLYFLSDGLRLAVTDE